MAEAQFMPAQSDPAGQFYRGAEFGQSFMARRQRMQWEAEDREEEKRSRALMQPVLEAQRQAQVATALSSLETTKQQQQLRSRFAAEAPVYNQKYMEAMKLPTFAEQQAALAKLQPEITWMGLLPEGKGFVDTVNNSRAMAFQSQMADEKIKATAQLSELENRRRLEEQGLINQGRIDLERERQKRPATSASLQGLIQSREQALEEGDTETATLLDQAIARKTAPVRRPGDRILDLRRQANEIRGADPQGAAMLDRLAEAESQRGAGSTDFAQQLVDVLKGASTPNSQQGTAVNRPPSAAPVQQTTEEIVNKITTW